MAHSVPASGPGRGLRRLRRPRRHRRAVGGAVFVAAAGHRNVDVLQDDRTVLRMERQAVSEFFAEAVSRVIGPSMRSQGFSEQESSTGGVVYQGPGSWTWQRNKRFINEALEGSDEVRLVTDPGKPMYAGGNTYKRELDYMQGRGYGWEQIDDHWRVTRVRP